MRSPLSVLSPEARLLVGALPAGLDLDPGDDTLVRPGESPRLDWEALYRLIGRERAAAALHPIPERLGIDPPPVWEQRLRALGATSGFRQRRLLRRLEEIVGLLTDSGLSVCLLKGAALALTRYREPLQRSMADLDLLVEPGRAFEAREVLTDAGWEWNRDMYPGELYDARPHLPPLEDPDGRGQFVELHHALFIEGHPFRFGGEHLRADARTVEVGGAEALAPAPATHLVYTCIHFAWSHILSKAGWRAFRDVAVLSRASEFDWDDFLARAVQADAARPCYWTLRLAGRVGGVEVPDRVLSGMRPSGLPETALRVLERHYTVSLFSTSPGDPGCPSVALSRALWRVGAQPGGPRGPGVLPWAKDEGFLRLDRDGDEPPGPLRRLLRHVGDAGSWMKYLGRVVAAADD